MLRSPSLFMLHSITYFNIYVSTDILVQYFWTPTSTPFLSHKRAQRDAFLYMLVLIRTESGPIFTITVWNVTALVWSPRVNVPKPTRLKCSPSLSSLFAEHI